MDSTQPGGAGWADKVEQALRPAGARHIADLARAHASEQQLRPLVLAALDAGIPLLRIVRLSGLTPALIERWTAEQWP